MPSDRIWRGLERLANVIGIIGATLVATVVQSVPLQQANAVSVYAHRALQAGENAYVTAVNANPTPSLKHSDWPRPSAARQVRAISLATVPKFYSNGARATPR